MVGMGDCESLPTHFRNDKTIAAGYLVLHFSGIQEALRKGEADYVFWFPGPENPASASTELKGGALPF